MVSVTSVIITAAYYLWTMQRMFLGKFNEKWSNLTPTLTLAERCTLWPLAVLTIFFGIFPMPVFALINPALHELARIIVATASA